MGGRGGGRLSSVVCPSGGSRPSAKGRGPGPSPRTAIVSYDHVLISLDPIKIS